MADILSQEEIDALLDVVDDETDLFEAGEESPVSNRQVTLYDFKRPNRVSKEQLRAFRGIHDKMAELWHPKSHLSCAPSLRFSFTQLIR